MFGLLPLSEDNLGNHFPNPGDDRVICANSIKTAY